MSNPFSLEFHCSVRLPLHLPQTPSPPPQQTSNTTKQVYRARNRNAFSSQHLPKHLRLSYLPVKH